MFGKILAIISSIILLIALIFGGIYFWTKTDNFQNKFLSNISTRLDLTSTGTTASSSLDVQNALQKILGFDQERVYLFLFLNNTELRPGGGFIGVYAVVKVEKGIPDIVQVQGTEILDNQSSRDFISTPPKPLKEYLDIPRWEFRDSNWYSDFASSSQKSLELYKLENGIMKDNIDAIIGITPTVIEQILKITGPITVDGIKFTSDNFTKILEYEVEYGFAEKGISFNDRKQILSKLIKELVKKITFDLFTNWPEYSELANKMIDQKHIIAYALDRGAQAVLEYKNMAGRIKQTTSDYLLWVDANLGALKTDAYLTRDLSYSIKPDKNGNYIGTVKMKYRHDGVYNWRSTKYRTYIKLYTPKGSQFISVKGAKVTEVDKGQEFGKQYFGIFAIIEPKTTNEVEWKFYLSSELVRQIQNGQYYLVVQKQIGTINHKLYLDLDFGKKVVGATPGEDLKYHGDNKYQYSTDLTVDRYFKVITK